MLFPLSIRYTLWHPTQQNSWPSAAYPACNTASPQWKHRVFFEALVPTAICFPLLNRTAKQRLGILFFVEPQVERHANVAQEGSAHRGNPDMVALHVDQPVFNEGLQPSQDGCCKFGGDVQHRAPPAHDVEDMLPYPQVCARKHMTLEHGQLSLIHPIGVGFHGFLVLREGGPGVADRRYAEIGRAPCR